MLTFANLVYVLRKELSPEMVDETLKTLSLIFTFEDLKGSDLVAASSLQWNDFEDALQSVTAERIGADYIITRNIKDFKGSRIPAFTPSEYLAKQ